MPYGGNRTNINGYGYNQRTPKPLNALTEKLFKAIDDENLEDFKQAIEEGADVNAFDGGYTPLMTIIVSGDDSPICLKMMMLLLQHRGLDINIQEIKERNTALHLAFCMENRNFVQMLLRHPNLNINIKNDYWLVKPEYQGIPAQYLYSFHRERVFHTPKEYIEQIGRVQKKDFFHLTIEIQKAQKGKQLLNALSSRNIYLAEVLLNEQLNPNCWGRDTKDEIQTSFDLIAKLCSEGMVLNRQEVLTKLLKHKELDFSQIKSTPSIERDIQLKRIIEQVIKERLTDAIGRKDLDDVKKLVEDNCFTSRAIVTAALRGVNNPIAPITNYLNEKFPASAAQPLANAHNITPEVNDEFIAQESQQLKSPNELEGTRTQITEEDVRHNLDKRRGNRSRIKKESDEPQRAISPDRKQSNYVSTFFILFGAFAIGACLAIENYPAVSAYFSAVALILFLVGYVLYEANKRDIEPGGAINNPQITRVWISSPGFVENFYTY